MTISATYAPDTYAGDGIVDTFAITFSFLSTSTNVKVSIKVDSTGVITEKAAATHYNVSGSNVVFTGGNLPASGETVILELSPDFKQTSDYTENSSFAADTLENDLDERTLEGQINNDLVSRAIGYDSAVTVSATLATLPDPTATANKDNYLKYNSDGTAIETFSLSTASGLGNVVDDTSPQLGGDLDLNSNNITGTGAITAVGIVTGTVLKATADSNQIVLDSDGTYTTTVTESTASSSKVITLPNATDTLVGKATTDALTNKTLDCDGTGNVVTNVGSSEVKSEMVTGQTEVTIAAGDSILLSDVDDSDNLKKDTVQGILDLVPAAGDTAAGLIEIATAAEQETASSTTLAVTPGRQHSHPSAAKAWILFNGTGTAAITASYNITSIADNGTGDYTVNIANDFSSADFCASVGAGAGNSSTTVLSVGHWAAPAAGTYGIQTLNSSFSALDAAYINVAFFGDQ